MDNRAFPQYRKYENDKSYFKIVSDVQFEQLEIIGSRYLIHSFTAKIYPDKILIKDLLSAQENNIKIIDEEEYLAMINYCRLNLKAI